MIVGYEAYHLSFKYQITHNYNVYEYLKIIKCTLEMKNNIYYYMFKSLTAVRLLSPHKISYVTGTL